MLIGKGGEALRPSVSGYLLASTSAWRLSEEKPQTFIMGLVFCLTTRRIDADLEDAGADESPHGDMEIKLIWQGDVGASKLNSGIVPIP